MVFLFLLCLLCGFCHALMTGQDESQLILSSDQIVYGKIVDVKSMWNAQNTHIVTTAYILVDEAFVKSDTTNTGSGMTVPVTVLGGTVGDTSEWVEDMPVFIPDTDVFVFLKETGNGKYTVNGLNEGVYVVNSDQQSSPLATAVKQIQKSSSPADKVKQIRERIIKTRLGIPVDIYPSVLSRPLAPLADTSAPVITSVTPSSASAGTDTQITITGSGFGTKASRSSYGDVAFFAKSGSSNSYVMWATGFPYEDINANGFILNGNCIDSWSDTQIKVRVPSGITDQAYWSGASSGFLVVLNDLGYQTDLYPFAVTFAAPKTWGSKQAKWNSAPSYYVNPGSVAGTLPAIQSAAATWNNSVQPGSFFRFDYGGLTSCTTVANDGKNVIAYGPAEDFADLPNVIAFASCGGSGGNYYDNCDIEMNPSFPWTTGTASGYSMNIETIILHELGHWTGLRDLYGNLPESGYSGYPSDLSPNKKVMFGINSDAYGNKNLKTLSSADIAGIRWLYPPTAVAIPVAKFSTNVSSGNVPLSVKFTDLSTGTSLNKWNWSFGDGVWFNTTTASLKNATHTYSAAGTYTAKLTVCNASGCNTTVPGTTITVSSPGKPVVKFTTNVTSGNIPLAVKFTDLSTGTSLNKWNWSFGDGVWFNTTTASLKNATHTYSAAGTYTAKLTVCNASGCNTTVPGTTITVGTNTASITVTSPNGEEIWTQNTTHMVTWSYTGSPGSTVKIELMKGGVFYQLLSSSTTIGSAGSGSYSWTIRTITKPGTDYKIRVTRYRQLSLQRYEQRCLYHNCCRSITGIDRKRDPGRCYCRDTHRR